ncbi:MAG TPA: cytochrome C oxidase subunit IV family protein [Acidimicrobiales bacterium]|nr:cytochrome C oxidase subunit IV family protein [Acidimicrobiales bacterium]|tara:strand:+ start:2584 stop:2910 length:327 start_codon:yes stop_codon:yes gene_type:complete
MSTSETTTEDHENHEDHEHPSDQKYMQIALLLAIITAAEVATYFVDIGVVLIPTLMVMMVVKFFIVAAWFMHLRFDSNMFTRFFVSGIVLAISVYFIFLTVFEFWTEG